MDSNSKRSVTRTFQTSTSIWRSFSIIWMRIAISVFVLYALHLVGSSFGFFIPIHFVFILLISWLGVPGIVSVVVISFFLQ